MDNVKPIASFCVDHRKIKPGMYLSRVDGDIVTFDLRTRTPNSGDYMDNTTMHSVEHLFATYVRNSPIGDQVIYFGPMGCQTGFYLVLRDPDFATVLETVRSVLRQIIAHDGPMFGASAVECGNYRSLNTEAAQLECERYLAVLSSQKDGEFSYEG